MNPRQFLNDDHGASSAEFALVLFPFMGLVFAFIGMGFLLYANSTLQWAVQDAARCAAIKTTICDNLADTQTYANQHYSGPNIAVRFTAYAKDNTHCGPHGYAVQGTAIFPLRTGLYNRDITLQAEACYPANP